MTDQLATPPLTAEAPAADMVEAARAFVPSATEVVPIAGRDHLVRVTTAAGAWRLRRWPAETTVDRIAFVHQVLAQARAEDITVAPAAAELPPPAQGTILTIAGRHFDMQTWLPGQTVRRSVEDRAVAGRPVDLPAALPDATFIALVQIVARLHATTARLARLPSAPSAPLSGMIGAVRAAWSDQRSRLRPIAPRTPLVQRWLATGERALPAAEAALAGGAPNPVTAVVHLGLWPAHVLLDQESRALVGLLGWESVAAGAPVLDLAQLIVRCRGWTEANAELAIGAYGDAGTLSPEERRILPAVAALDLIATAGNLLDVAFGERPDEAPPPSSALRAAAGELVSSLETVTAVLAQPEKSKRPVRRPRSPAGGPARPKPPQSRRRDGRPSKPRRPG